MNLYLVASKCYFFLQHQGRRAKLDIMSPFLLPPSSFPPSPFLLPPSPFLLPPSPFFPFPLPENKWIDFWLSFSLS